MMFFILLVGIVSGGILGQKIAEYTLILYYHNRLRNEDKFYDIFDSIDDEFHFKMYSGTTGNPPKKYADYLKAHQDIRPKAHNIYMSYLDRARRYLTTLILIALVAPSLVLLMLTGWWYLYLTGAALTIIGFIGYIRFAKDNGLEFHAILMTSIVLNDKDLEKKH